MADPDARPLTASDAGFTDKDQSFVNNSRSTKVQAYTITDLDEDSDGEPMSIPNKQQPSNHSKELEEEDDDDLESNSDEEYCDATYTFDLTGTNEDDHVSTSPQDEKKKGNTLAASFDDLPQDLIEHMAEAAYEAEPVGKPEQQAERMQTEDDHHTTTDDDDEGLNVKTVKKMRKNSFGPEFNPEDGSRRWYIDSNNKKIKIPKTKGPKVSWTKEEIKALEEGLEYYRGTQWAEILKRKEDVFKKNNRDNISLKDKARNEYNRRVRMNEALGGFRYYAKKRRIDP
ncbi:hypothetical protein BDF20DRAFT_917640 [Mycotypha africana]|uniref:uncharacterized protein n=1 Tax=Mycotypha africana TaxID=64632 RepID=UPI002300C21A|nr:uncharacterized protein BDF20DRAFT_917640 [Mycotypha africana]KAI8967407.1 hypothetical protein BDF20DRAFT_917640 [Mycotypha africana]